MHYVLNRRQKDREEYLRSFDTVVAQLSSDKKASQLSAAILMRTLPTGVFQKTLGDGLAYAGDLSGADLQRTNLQDKVGYTFGGHISGLTEWGMYVEIEPTMIEGMVSLRDIRSDFFEFDQDHYRLVGKRTGIVYNLGDPVRIRVMKTNLEQKLLDYELIETGLEDRIYDRIDYESGRGTSFIKGEDGSFDNVTVGINKAARKEKVRKAIQESKRKARKAAGKKK
mgnify:FL=1